jgi:hypothetical protein
MVRSYLAKKVELCLKAFNLNIMAQQPSKPEIVYSCYHQVGRGGEQFIQDHVFSYHIAGTLTVNDGNNEHTFKVFKTTTAGWRV